MRAVRSVPLYMAALGLTGLMFLAGCGGTPTEEGTGPEPAEQPELGPVVEGFYPQGTRTGIPAVDKFTEALWADGTEALLDQYQTVELPCRQQPGSGAPVCPEGVPAGTPVKVYPYAWCDLTFLTDRQELTSHVGPELAQNKNLFAVYRPEHVPGLAQLSPAYAIVLGAGLGRSAPTVYLDQDGSVLLVRTGCGTPDLAVPVDAEIILAPKVTASDEERRTAERELAGMVEYEVQQMHRSLRIGLGEYDPCEDAPGPLCNQEADLPGTITGAIMRCEKVGPDAQMSGYAYDEQRLGPVFVPYKEACDTLRDAQASMGAPEDNEQWRGVAVEARSILDPAVEHIASQAGN